MLHRDSLSRILVAAVLGSLPVWPSARAQAPKPADDGKSIFDDDGTMPAPRPKSKPADGAPKLLAVPAGATRDKADKLVRNRYSTDLLLATKPPTKTTLARKLIKAAETVNDPAEKYATLLLAADVASQAYNLECGLAAIDALSDSYKVDALTMKRDLFGYVSKSPLASMVLKQCAPVISDALEADRYDIAKDIATVAATVARGQGGSEVQNAVLQNVIAIEKAHAAAADAQAVLAKNDDDPDANLTVGRFKCFYKGDWTAGLPRLAKGSDADLKALAIEELKPTRNTKTLIVNGDRLWDLAAGQKDPIAKNHLLERADYWYRLALPDVGGPGKTHVQARLARQSETPGKGAATAVAGSPLGTWEKADNGSLITFTADGKFSVIRKNGKTAAGAWRLSGRNVIVTFSGKDVELTFVTNDDLVDKDGSSGWKLKRVLQ